MLRKNVMTAISSSEDILIEQITLDLWQQTTKGALTFKRFPTLCIWPLSIPNRKTRAALGLKPFLQSFALLLWPARWL